MLTDTRNVSPTHHPFLQLHRRLIGQYEKVATHPKTMYYEPTHQATMTKKGKKPIETKVGYHKFFLRKNAKKSHSAIAFADCMEYDECSLYFASLEANSKGGVMRRNDISMQENRPSCLTSLENLSTTNLKSCLRTSRFSTPKPVKSVKECMPRRCSVTERPTNTNLLGRIKRANSSRNWEEAKPKVEFKETVTEYEIFGRHELPASVRSQMFMSMDELVMCARGAREERRQKHRTRLVANNAEGAKTVTEMNSGQANLKPNDVNAKCTRSASRKRSNSRRATSKVLQ